MPLQLPITDPYSRVTSPDGFAWAWIVAFDNKQKRMRLVYLLHPSMTAAFSGGEPYPEQIEILIGPVEKPAEYGPAPLLDPGSPAVPPTFQFDEQGSPVLDGAGNPIVLVSGVEAVPPTYGPPPVLVPRVPSYDEVLAAHAALFAALADAVDAEARAIAPAFAAATVIPRSGS